VLRQCEREPSEVSSGQSDDARYRLSTIWIHRRRAVCSASLFLEEVEGGMECGYVRVPASSRNSGIRLRRRSSSASGIACGLGGHSRKTVIWKPAVRSEWT